MTQPPENQPNQDPHQPDPYQKGPSQPGPYQAGPYQPAPYQPGPYPPGPYQGGPVSPHPKPSGSGKIIAIVVGAIVLLILLVCGGFIAASLWFAKEVDDAFDEFDPNREGGRNNPITVEEGESFEIDGIEYADGWSITAPTDDYGGHSIADLKATNDRSDESRESVYIYFTFVDEDAEEIGEIRCSSDGAITYGNSETLECSSSKPIDGAHERIEVSSS